MNIDTTLSALRMGEPTTFGGLTVFPLLGTIAQREYVTLDEALREGSVLVSEVSNAGSVPELRLVNRGRTPVFLLDGEELVGAKQNRVLNLSVMAPAQASLEIPVSCVEQGRWQSGQTQFQSGSHVHFATGRSKKVQRVSESMEQRGERRSDQGEVWSDIQGLFSRLGASSRTQAMADAFEGKALDIERYVAAFSVAPGQTGVAFGLAGKVQGLDLFDSPETLSCLLPKLVRSWALDAIARGVPKECTIQSGSLERFLARVTAADVLEQEAVGLGKDLRLGGPRVAGAALSCFDRLVHVAAFRVEDESASPTTCPQT